MPGSSTMNQLEKILEVCGKPSAEDIAAIHSSFSETMLASLPEVAKKKGIEPQPRA
jgi:mitogen-activated protein kinase 15|tara:strand:- start:215 stop:382 length:168 start_codon:yes stop_codon:yes gene_type:complete